MSRYCALITGGSDGIGREFALACAREGYDIAIVALPDPQLDVTVQAVKHAAPVRCFCLGIDLTKAGAGQAIVGWVRQQGLAIRILINNAGIGYTGRFEAMPSAQLRNLIAVNTLLSSELCHALQPDLFRNSPSYVLNMSSLAGTLPLPYYAVYTGTKHFLYSFSLALRREWKKHVAVSVMCPGPILTNHPRHRRRARLFGFWAGFITLTTREVAQIGLQGMFHNEGLIIPKRTNRWLVRLMRFLPIGIRLRILDRLFVKLKEEHRFESTCKSLPHHSLHPTNSEGTEQAARL
ncbi:SDR family NAD(P)-dependent oxidoreductase [Larkinella sp. VNQ87]|uniref:SDR family NAD(P)-dependent oxidoreductase n=1 Tax=Larkinella sp. VNQ87 TaxID=3400921 RepID=UPI003BFCF7E4